MKKILLLLAISFPLFLSAQLVTDDFESYTVGDFDSQWDVNNWVGWFGLPSLTTISDEQANSGVNSMKIEQNDDIVALLGILDAGIFEVSYEQYVPTGNAAYANIQHNYTNTAGDWMFEVYVLATGDLDIRVNGQAINAPGIGVFDQWVNYTFTLNFITSVGVFNYNGQAILEFPINTNAAGGVGLNQVNGINFFGGCLPAGGCTSLAYYDDITVTEIPVPPHNASVINPAAVSEYRTVPLGLETPITLATDVVNIGGEAVTDVSVTFTLKDGAGTTILTETSNTVASIPSGETASFEVPTTFSLSGIDIYTMDYEVSIAETDSDLADNLLTSEIPFSSDPNIYARDNGVFDDGVGVNGATGIIGQTFEFVEATTVESIIMIYAGGITGDTINGYIYSLNGTSPDQIIATTEMLVVDQDGGGIGAEATEIMSFTTPVELMPGNYLFAIEQVSLNNMLLSTSADVFTLGTSWASTDEGLTWANLEDFNIRRSLGIRPFISQVGVNVDESASNYVSDLKITPNPTSDIVTIQLDLLEVQDLQIEVYNMSGQKLKTLAEKNTIGGQFQLNLQTYPSGVYTINIQIGEQVINRKVVLMK